MKAMALGIRRVAKLWLLAAIILGGAAMLAQESRPVRAADTAIIVSLSNTSPVPTRSMLIAYPNGPPVTFYVWAQDVSDPQGMAAFQVELDYSTLVANPQAPVLTVASIAEDSAWLATSGRSVSCVPRYINNTIGRAYASCFTLGAENQWGVQGTGLIGTLTIQPGTVEGSGKLNFTPSFMQDTGQVIGSTIIEPQTIPATRPSLSFVIPPCADFNGDGRVTFIGGDIIAIISRYNMRAGDLDWGPYHYDWDPMYDLNHNGRIDFIGGDIILAIAQFTQRCTR